MCTPSYEVAGQTHSKFHLTDSFVGKFQVPFSALEARTGRGSRMVNLLVGKVRVPCIDVELGQAGLYLSRNPSARRSRYAKISARLAKSLIAGAEGQVTCCLITRANWIALAMHHVEELEGSWDGSSYKKKSSSSAESLPARYCSSEHSPMNSIATYSSAPCNLRTRRRQTRRYVRSREPRLRWTQDLHQSFVRAIEQLGGHESEHGSVHLIQLHFAL